MRTVQFPAAVFLAALCLVPSPPPPAKADFVGTLVGTEMALTMMPQLGQALSVAGPIVGEPAAISLWSASDPLLWARRSPVTGTCFAAVSATEGSSGSLCQTPASALLASLAPGRRPAPRPQPPAADLSDLFAAFEALKGDVARAMRPGPTPVRELAPRVLEAWQQGDGEAALAHAETALRRSVEEFGTEDVETALALGIVGQVCLARGERSQAEGYLRRALEIGRQQQRADIQAMTWLGLASWHQGEGRPEKWSEALRTALSLAPARDEMQELRVTALSQLARAYELEGNLARALELHSQALATARPIHPGGSPELSALLVRDAGLQRAAGELAAAERQLAEAQRASRTAEPPPLVAMQIAGEAGLQARARGDYEAAETHLREAVGLADRRLGEAHEVSALMRVNLGVVLRERGDVEQALGLIEATANQAVAAGSLGRVEELLLLHSLADAYTASGHADCATPLYESVRGGLEATVGADHPWHRRVQASIAAVERQAGRLDQAEAQLVDMSNAESRRLGEHHPEVATIVNNLGEIARLAGRHAEAAELLQSALRVKARTLGDDHPDVATIRLNQAALAWSEGDHVAAVAAARDSFERRQRTATALLTYGSEAQRLAFARQLAAETDFLIALHHASRRPDADSLQLALDTVLARKGRVLDASVGLWRLLRAHGDAATEDLRRAWQRASLHYAELVASGGGGGDLQAAAIEVETLERALAARGVPLEAGTARPDADTIRATLPAKAALVEFVRFTPISIADGRAGEARYAAFLLRPDEPPQLVDIGPAESIDTRVFAFQRGLIYRSPLVDQVARELHARLIEPLEAGLKDRTLLVIAPDSALNLLPFAVLRDAVGRYLLDLYTIAYVTTARDVPGATTSTASSQPALIIADPDYGEASPADLCTFGQLAGARPEGEAIARLLPQAQLATGAGASEVLVKTTSRPRLLHFATHGFAAGAPAGLFCAPAGEPERHGSPRQLTASMAWSGLALAHFNRGGADGEDGFLSALEVAALDLGGTQLVVLSACESGLGTVEAGESVFGLRRAFLIAGAQAQVMSLWAVDDAATTVLMTRFYEELIAGGASRVESLRAAQIAVRAREGWEHPTFWGAFVLTGAWAPLL